MAIPEICAHKHFPFRLIPQQLEATVKKSLKLDARSNRALRLGSESVVENDGSEMRCVVEHRFESVEFRLFWGRHVNRRWIALHTIAFDGFRWHARAFCLIGACFKDFALSRILDVRDFWECEMSSGDDSDCNSKVTLEVRPIVRSLRCRPRKSRLTTACEAARRKSRSGARIYNKYVVRWLGFDADLGTNKPQV